MFSISVWLNEPTMVYILYADLHVWCTWFGKKSCFLNALKTLLIWNTCIFAVSIYCDCLWQQFFNTYKILFRKKLFMSLNLICRKYRKAGTRNCTNGIRLWRPTRRNRRRNRTISTWRSAACDVWRPWQNGPLIYTIIHCNLH